MDLADSELDTQLTGVLSELMDAQEKSEVHLIHNASRLLNDSALDTSDESLRDVLQVNLVSINTINRNIIPRMGPRSSILFIGSTLSEKAVPGSFSYVTTKHAQIGAMRALCQDLVDSGIHTAAICPGFTDTEMLRSHVPESAMKEIAQLTTFRRLIKPDEIAETVFFASQNPVVNGSVIHANLGQIER